MKQLFRCVIWPAVAGNVAWAFFTVLLQEYGSAESNFFYERLTLLALLAGYLGLDWSNTEDVHERLRKYSWLGDAPLALAIAALAIAAQLTLPGGGGYFLIAVFIASAVAHGFDAWVPTDTTRSCKKKLYWIILNLVASGIVLIGGTLCYGAWGWHLPLAAGLVVFCWAGARRTQFRLFDVFRY